MIRFIKLNDVALEYIHHLKRNGTSSDYSIESVYRIHIKKVLGNRKIKSIRLKDIKDLQNSMLEKTYNGNHSYANKTINMVTGVLNMIMNYALKYEYITINPCSNYTSLRIIKTYDKIKFWTDKEFEKAIVYEKDFVWYTYLVISYLTGMRKGEMRGLKWIDINFDKEIIVINRHINDKLNIDQRQNRDKERLIEGRKNGSSHIILMDKSTYRLLHKLKVESSKELGWNEQSYVFGIDNPVGQNTPKRHLDKIAELSGIPRITIHGLRHSHVSYLISKGLNVYEVAERLGDTIEMIVKVYGHMFPNPQKNIVEVLNENFDFIFDEKNG